MITEDYVSFEIAKLLKEKGFDEKCSHYWQDEISKYSITKEIHKWTDSALANTEISSPKRFSAPTIQMATKWLREVYGIFISICNGNHKKDNRDTSTPDNVYYFFVITDDRAVYEEEKQCLKEFISYEEAAEAAIKYCLENLI